MRRKHNDIDKAFTDRAWSEMKALLDREMPVENKREKPVFWWWLFGALFAGLIIGGLGVWYVANGAGNESSSPSEKPVEEHLPPLAPVAAIGQAAASQPAATFTEGKNGPEKSKSDEHTQPAPPKIAQQANTLYAAAEETTWPLEPATERSQHAAESKIESTPSRKTALFPGTLLGLAALRELRPSAQQAPAPSIPEGNQSNLKIKSFYFAAQHSVTAGGYGFAAGIQRHFPVGHSRWMLSLGAGYAYLQRPLFIRQTDTLGTNSALQTGQTEYSFEELNQDELFLTTEAVLTLRQQDLAMHYLELPLSVSRSFSRRFGMVAGLTPSVLLATAPDLASGGLFRAGSNFKATEDMAPGNPAEANDSATLVPVSGFDLKLNGGMYYRIRPAWKLALTYEHGLVDVLEGNDTKEFHRLLRFGVHYTPSGK